MKRLTTLFSCAAIAVATIASTVQAASIFDDQDLSVPRLLTNFVIGNEFTVGSSDVEIDALGVWDELDDGLAESHEVGLWDSSGALVASETVPAGVAGVLEDSFRYVPLTANVTLLAGQQYRIAALYTSQNDAFNDVDRDRGGTGEVAVTPGFGLGTIDDDYFQASATLVRPTTLDTGYPEGNGRWSGANARMVIPERTAMALVSL